MQLNFLKAIETDVLKTETSHTKPAKTTSNFYEFFSDVSLEFEKVPNKTIKDFGEKIGGAKKDLWKSRGMNLSDLDDLTDREAAKFVTKNYVWPKPNYEKMVEEGMDAVTVFLIKKIRDSLPAKVRVTNDETINKELRQKYITFLTEIKTHIKNMNLIEPNDLFDLKYLVLEKYYSFSARIWLENSRNHPAFTNRFLKALQIGARDIVKAKREVEKTGFPEKREAWRKYIHIKKSDTDNSYYIYEYEKRDGLRGTVLAEGFSSKKEAENFLKEELKDKLKDKSKRSKSKTDEPVRPQLKYIQRIGTDYRNGKNVEGNDFMNVFSFRGGEFGNWLNQADRQQYLNHAYDALMDLANILGVKPSKLSMGKKLAIAFGARGSGRASAHYEPARIVINLTKMRGAGSLAHEMGHAFDDYLGRLSGLKGESTYLTKLRYEKSNLPNEVVSIFKDLLYTIRTVLMKKEDMIKKYEKEINNYNQNIKRSTDSIIKELERETGHSSKPRRAATEDEFKKITEYINNIENNIESENNLDKLNKLHKSIKGIMISKNTRDILNNHFFYREIKFENLFEVQNGEFSRTTDSNYLKEAKKIDKTRKKPYWSTNIELFARAFECFVYDELLSKGLRSDYLVYGVTNGKEQKFKPYPEGEEREKINEKFRKLFKTLIENNVL